MTNHSAMMPAACNEGTSICNMMLKVVTIISIYLQNYDFGAYHWFRLVQSAFM